MDGHGVAPHSYAYDTQVSGSCRPSDVSVFSSSISYRLRDVAGWKKSNRLRLNSSNTEVICCATSRRKHLLASAQSVDVVMVDAVTSVRDLGIYIDADQSMITHVQKAVCGVSTVLSQLQQIRRLTTPATFQTLVVAFVMFRPVDCPSDKPMDRSGGRSTGHVRRTICHNKLRPHTQHRSANYTAN